MSTKGLSRPLFFLLFVVIATVAGIRASVQVYWNSAPNPVFVGQSYTISASAVVDDQWISDAAYVTIYRNGTAVASGSGGRGASATISYTEGSEQTINFSARGRDAHGGYEYIAHALTVTRQSQTVWSANTTINYGASFTPPYYGGGGTGSWQFIIAGYTNWPGVNGTGQVVNSGEIANPGTWLGESGPRATSWTPPAPGNYQFAVRKLGDGGWHDSNIAHWYTVTVNPPPSAVISANTTSTYVNNGVTFTVTGTAPGGSLTGINLDVISPNSGFFKIDGGPYTFNGTPPNNGGMTFARTGSKSQSCVLTFTKPGNYQFRGAVCDELLGWYGPGYSSPITITVPNRDPSVSIQILDGSRNVIGLDGNGRARIPLNSSFYIRVNGSDPDGRLARIYSRVNDASGSGFAYDQRDVSGGSANWDFGPYNTGTSSVGAWDVWGHAEDIDNTGYQWQGGGWWGAHSPDLDVYNRTPSPVTHNVPTTITNGDNYAFSFSTTDPDSNLGYITVHYRNATADSGWKLLRAGDVIPDEPWWDHPGTGIVSGSNLGSLSTTRNWSPDLGVGNYEFHIRAIDGSRAQSFASTWMNVTNRKPDTAFDTANDGYNGGTITGNGWAADFEDGAPVSRVEVWVDDAHLDNAALGGDRPDVANAYGRSDYRDSGFSYNFTVNNLTIGSHTAKIRAVDSAGAVTEATRTFNVANAAPTVSLTGDRTSANMGDTITLTLSGADVDNNLRAVNLWVKTPKTDWRNIRADSTLNSYYVEDTTTDNAISSGVNVGSLGARHLSFTFRPTEGYGTYEFHARSIDEHNLSGDTAVVNVTVNNRAPSAQIRATTTSPRVGDFVTFYTDGQDSDGDLTRLTGWIRGPRAQYVTSDWSGWSNLFDRSFGITGSATQPFTWTPSVVGFYQYHGNAYDSVNASSSNGNLSTWTSWNAWVTGNVTAGNITVTARAKMQLWLEYFAPGGGTDGQTGTTTKGNFWPSDYDNTPERGALDGHHYYQGDSVRLRRVTNMPDGYVAGCQIVVFAPDGSEVLNQNTVVTPQSTSKLSSTDATLSLQQVGTYTIRVYGRAQWTDPNPSEAMVTYYLPVTNDHPDVVTHNLPSHVNPGVALNLSFSAADSDQNLRAITVHYRNAATNSAWRVLRQNDTVPDGLDWSGLPDTAYDYAIVSSLDNQASLAVDRTWTPDLGSGEYEFHIRAIDGKGNEQLRDHWMAVTNLPAAVVSVTGPRAIIPGGTTTFRVNIADAEGDPTGIHVDIEGPDGIRQPIAYYWAQQEGWARDFTSPNLQTIGQWRVIVRAYNNWRPGGASYWGPEASTTIDVLDTSGDADGDGITNALELQLGLDPSDPSDVTIQQFEYDKTGRLKRGPGGEYIMDAEGNITGGRQ